MTVPEPPPRWRADDPVDPHWSAPSPAQPHPAWPAPPEPPPRRRRLVLVLAPVVGLALLIALTAGFGGFRQRTDRVHDVAVGGPISTGPYVFTLQRATAQSVDSLGQRIVRVIVYGTVANTGDEGQTPSTSQFYGKKPTDPSYASVQYVNVGTSSDGTGGQTVTPGLPPVELRLTYEFDGRWTPTDSFRVVITDLTQVDRTLGGKDPHLEPDPDTAYRVTVPVRVLPRSS